MQSEHNCYCNTSIAFRGRQRCGHVRSRLCTLKYRNATETSQTGSRVSVSGFMDTCHYHWMNVKQSSHRSAHSSSMTKWSNRHDQSNHEFPQRQQLRPCAHPAPSLCNAPLLLQQAPFYLYKRHKYWPSCRVSASHRITVFINLMSLCHKHTAGKQATALLLSASRVVLHVTEPAKGITRPAVRI